MSGALGPPISFAFLSLFFFPSSCSIAFLKEVKCCSIQTLPGIHGCFYQREKWKFDPHGQIWRDKCWCVWAVVPFHSSCVLCTLQFRYKGAGVRKGEAHTVLVAATQRCFPFMLSCATWDSSLASWAMWLTRLFEILFSGLYKWKIVHVSLCKKAKQKQTQAVANSQQQQQCMFKCSSTTVSNLTFCFLISGLLETIINSLTCGIVDFAEA